MSERDYITISEAAAELGIPPRTLAYRLERGLMRGERVNARLWLVPRSEVEQWRGVGRLRPGRRPNPRPEN
jgi:excisionase family DNA binding protein